MSQKKLRTRESIQANSDTDDAHVEGTMMVKEHDIFKGEGKVHLKVKEWVCDACGYSAALKIR